MAAALPFLKLAGVAALFFGGGALVRMSQGRSAASVFDFASVRPNVAQAPTPSPSLPSYPYARQEMFRNLGDALARSPGPARGSASRLLMDEPLDEVLTERNRKDLADLDARRAAMEKQIEESDALNREMERELNSMPLPALPAVRRRTR